MINLIVSGLTYGSILFLIASGLTIILGVLRVVNFAHGSLFLFGAFFTFYFSQNLASLTGSIWISILLGGCVVAVIGVLFERILRVLYDRELEYQLIFTFAFVYIFFDLQSAVFGTTSKSLSPPGFIDTMLGGGITTLQVFFITTGLVLVFILFYIFHKTKFGVDARTVSFDREMAGLLGINVNRVYIITFAIGAFVSGVGGGLMLFWLPAVPAQWEHFTLLALVVIVIGGLGSIEGAYIGSLLVGLLSTFGSAYFPSLSATLPLLIMGIFLLLKPTGLLGRGGL